MFLSKVLSCCTVFVFVCGFPALAQEFDLPNGLSFGATFSEVEATAQSRGWDLDQTTTNSNAWSVDAMGLTFYFCGQTLTTVDQYVDGGLRAFIETVWNLQLKFGEPDTDAFILSPRSLIETHGLQSVFEPGQGMEVSVQIYLKDDAETVWTRTSDSSVCQEN